MRSNKEKAERGLGRQSTQEPLIGLQQQFKCSPKADSQAATAAVADIPSDSLFSCVPIKRLIVEMPFPFAVDLPFAAHNKGTVKLLELTTSLTVPRVAEIMAVAHSHTCARD